MEILHFFSLSISVFQSLFNFKNTPTTEHAYSQFSIIVRFRDTISQNHGAITTLSLSPSLLFLSVSLSTSWDHIPSPPFTPPRLIEREGHIEKKREHSRARDLLLLNAPQRTTHTSNPLRIVELLSKSLSQQQCIGSRERKTRGREEEEEDENSTTENMTNNRKEILLSVSPAITHHFSPSHPPPNPWK